MVGVPCPWEGKTESRLSLAYCTVRTRTHWLIKCYPLTSFQQCNLQILSKFASPPQLKLTRRAIWSLRFNRGNLDMIITSVLSGQLHPISYLLALNGSCVTIHRSIWAHTSLEQMDTMGFFLFVFLHKETKNYIHVELLLNEWGQNSLKMCCRLNTSKQLHLLRLMLHSQEGSKDSEFDIAVSQSLLSLSSPNTSSIPSLHRQSLGILTKWHTTAVTNSMLVWNSLQTSAGVLRKPTCVIHISEHMEIRRCSIHSAFYRQKKEIFK